jgi:hypothetical protein
MPAEFETAQQLSRKSFVWPAIIAACYFLLHMATAGCYGYFRDAMYYLDCGRHLAWGYVDQPPLIALLAWITEHTLGTSLYALIFWSALAGAARILLIAAFALRLGAGRFGAALAALLAATPAAWIVIDHQFAMNAWEALFWTGCAYVVLRMMQTANTRLWLAFGAIAGLGLENKYSIAVFGFALLAGLMLTSSRKLLFTPWLLAGGAVALVIFLPNLLWNIHHHWPFFELMRNIRASGRDIVLPPLAYLKQQVLMMNPATLPFWLGGLAYFFVRPRGRRYAVFGWAFVITIALFMLAHGKDYYSASAYPVLLAGGACAAESLWLASAAAASRRAIFRAACAAWLAAGIVLVLPMTLPVLSIEGFLRYQARFPLHAERTERGHLGAALPQYYADEFGWPQMVAAVAGVYNRLTPEEREHTTIYAANFGEAGAVDLFGPQYGLPQVVCPHQTYYLWGPRDSGGQIMILIGSDDIDEARKYFDSVEVAARLDNPYGEMNEGHPILLARGLHGSLQALWPELKDWD